MLFNEIKFQGKRDMGDRKKNQKRGKKSLRVLSVDPFARRHIEHSGLQLLSIRCQLVGNLKHMKMRYRMAIIARLK
jgi:hypothetical protein